MRRASMLGAVAVVAAVSGLSVARADIPPPPPPPPTIPALNTTLPAPWQVVAGGLALSTAIASGGLVWARSGARRGGARWPGWMAGVVAGVVALGALGVAGLSALAAAEYQRQRAQQEAEYARQLRDWRPRGPVRRDPPAAAPVPAPASVPNPGSREG